MTKEELNTNLLDALNDFQHQSIQAVGNDDNAFELARAINRLMDTFRENIIKYLD